MSRRPPCVRLGRAEFLAEWQGELWHLRDGTSYGQKSG